jgi:hypothetical protein
MNENPEVANLRAELQAQLAEARGRQQEQAAELEKLRSVLEKVVEAADRNAATFRDTIQILDAKSCVQEAILRDLAGDLGVGLPMLPEGCTYSFATKRLPDGTLNVGHYFDEWKQKLLQEEAAAEDPYAGAVMFGGDYHAEVDEPPGPDHT